MTCAVDKSKLPIKLNISYTNGSETMQKIDDNTENFPNSVASATKD